VVSKHIGIPLQVNVKNVINHVSSVMDPHPIIVNNVKIKDSSGIINVSKNLLVMDKLNISLLILAKLNVPLIHIPISGVSVTVSQDSMVMLDTVTKHVQEIHILML